MIRTHGPLIVFLLSIGKIAFAIGLFGLIILVTRNVTALDATYF